MIILYICSYNRKNDKNSRKMAGRVITIDEELQGLYNRIQANDKEYTDMFEKLSNLWSKLDDESLSSQKKMDIVLSGEYILTKLRTYVTDEHFKVKSFLSRKDVPPSWIAVFKQRDATLSTYGLKITDLRDDIETLSKVAWFFRDK